MDDTPEDRKAIQPAVNQIVFYPLSDFDGKMKTMKWAQAPAVPGPKSEGGGRSARTGPGTEADPAPRADPGPVS